MPYFVETSVVDRTFDAWWAKFGRRPDTVKRALDQTISQINGTLERRRSGPFPPEYVPPPWRRPDEGMKGPQQSGGSETPHHSKQDFERYREKSGQGVVRARAELLSLERQFKIQQVLIEMNTYAPGIPGRKSLDGYFLPPDVKEELANMRCFVKAADRERREREILRAHWDEIARYNKKGPVAMQGRPGNYITYEQYIARQKKVLDDLDFLTKNPIGAGFYGIQRQAGRGHDDAMDRARDTQRIFNVFAGAASGEAARYKMESQVRKAAVPNKEPPAVISPGWPYGPGSTH